MNDVLMKVVDGQLIIDNNNTCNFVRDYKSHQNSILPPLILEEIICSTQFKISSDGVLNFPNIKLSSESFNDPAVITVGTVELALNAQNVQIVGNNLTQFKVSGTTTTLDVGIYSGDGVVDASNLTANKVSIFHRGSNDITVRPQQELTGCLKQYWKPGSTKPTTCCKCTDLVYWNSCFSVNDFPYILLIEATDDKDPYSPE